MPTKLMEGCPREPTITRFGATSSAAAPSQQISQDMGRIMIVAPNAITRQTLRLCLEGAGHPVLEAPTAAMALSVIAQEVPQLVLADARLEETDGPTPMLEMCWLCDWLQVPILVFSEDRDRLQAVKQRSVGRVTFLVKPFHPSHLLRIAHSCMNWHYFGPQPAEHRQLWLFNPPSSSAEKKTPPNAKLLVVEDSRHAQTGVSAHLLRLGLHVTTAETGAKALEIVRTSPPAAIVAETLTHELDGYELCLAVRQISREFPVILTAAGHVEEADWRLAESVGASAFALHSPDNFLPVEQALRATVPITLRGLATGA